MKHVFTNLILGLLLTTSAQIAHAGIGQIAKNAAQYVLKKVGNNPGWVAYAGLLPLMYLIYDEPDPILEPKEKVKRIGRAAGLVAFASIAFSAACNWWASKL